MGKRFLSGSSTTRTPSAFAKRALASLTESGLAKRATTASEWARGTGTRTQVGTICRPGNPKIFRVSSTILFSSSL